MGVVSFTPRSLYPQNQSGLGGEEKTPSPCWYWNPSRPARLDTMKIFVIYIETTERSSYTTTVYI
jgi:hypothetical protein